VAVHQQDDSSVEPFATQSFGFKHDGLSLRIIAGANCDASRHRVFVEDGIR
jgi:hypothetical protein